MSSDPVYDTAIIRKLLIDRSVLPKEEYLSGEHPNNQAIGELYDEIVSIREILQSFSKGDFSLQITKRGTTWGYLKSLQANLQHLTWQVEQVAAGDLSQRVDFMGDFSVAFNKMVLQLEHSLEEMKEKEAAERTQLMLDATPLGCCFWNEHCEIIDCNLEAVKLFGLGSKQEFLERFFELSPEYQPDGRLSAEVVREKLREGLEKGYVKCEYLHQKLDGEPIPSEVTIVRVFQKDHYIVAGYTRDLRELKKQQSELEQQRLLLLNILNSSPICFAILVEGNVKFSSPFITQFLGVGVNDSFVDYFVDQQSGRDLLAGVEKEVGIEWQPVTLRSKEHGIKEMLANMFMTDYYGEQGMIIWLVDITEIRRFEADLRIAKETAEYLGHVKDEFIANMSHELRTPMNAVFGVIHLLQHTSLSEEQSSYINTMEVSAKHLLKMIDDILDFSKLEAGKIFIKTENFDVRQTFADVQFILRETTEEKHLKMVQSVDVHVPALVTGDAMRLQQVLLSLVENALKFTHEGEVHLCAEFESSEGDNIVLRFSVQDTGIGIASEYMEQIFLPFSQVDTSRTRKYGGVGLGLSIAKNLVEVMGGRIWCESEVDQGTTFFFTATFKLPKIGLGFVDFPESFQGQPILLVEDNKINQIIAAKMLQVKGFNVDIAPDGLQAVEMVKQKEYALVLMDIQMPVMDGIQATQEIRNDPRSVSLPIVALTANAMKEDCKQYLAVGMNDLVAKPIDPVTLYQAILKWAKPVSTLSEQQS